MRPAVVQSIRGVGLGFFILDKPIPTLEPNIKLFLQTRDATQTPPPPLYNLIKCDEILLTAKATQKPSIPKPCRQQPAASLCHTPRSDRCSEPPSIQIGQSGLMLFYDIMMSRARTPSLTGKLCGLLYYCHALLLLYVLFHVESPR